MKDAAIALGALGMFIHPLEPEGKKPLTRWRDSATQSAETIGEWWAKWPDANVAISTGPLSGVWVLDIDGPEGEKAIEPFNLPETAEVQTAKGRHIYFRWANGIRTNAGRLAASVDVRGVGGYVVAPPSVHSTGVVYEWVRDLTHLKDAPDTLIEAILGTHEAPAAVPDAIRHPVRHARAMLDRAREDVAKAPEGKRNETLNLAGYALVAHIDAGSVSRDEVESVLLDAAKSAGVADKEAKATLKSALDSVGNVATAGRIAQGRAEIEKDDRPALQVRTDEFRMLGEFWGLDLGLYRTPGGDLTTEDQVFTPDTFVSWITRHVRLFKYSRETGEETAARFTATHAKLILSDTVGAEGLPLLRGILDAPVFVGNRIVDTPGYDAATGYFLRPSTPVREVPEHPDSDDVSLARSILDSLLEHFDWVDGSGHAHAMAAFLTPIVRDLFDGPIPGFWFDATDPGSGKSLLAKCASIIATGHAPMGILPSRRDELEKQISARLLANTRAVFIFDNVRERVASGPLEALLTSTRWTGRRLGVSETVEVGHRAVMFLTANNAELSSDMARRMIAVRIRKKPDEWVPPFDLEQVVSSNRGEIIWALLTLTQAWIAAEKPAYVGRLLKSFEGWAAVVGGVLAMAGYRGFLENFETASKDAQEVEIPTPVLRILLQLENTCVATSVSHVLERVDIDAAEKRRAQMTMADVLRSRGWVPLGRCRRPHPFQPDLGSIRANFWEPPPCQKQ